SRCSPREETKTVGWVKGIGGLQLSAGHSLQLSALSCQQDIVQFRAVRIAIGADHAGFLLKEHLKQTLQRLGHTFDDHGTINEEPVDYPPICADVARAVAEGRADRGIVLGGSGQGEQIAANKISGIRAALCNDLYTARLSRAHNDANVL